MYYSCKMHVNNTVGLQVETIGPEEQQRKREEHLVIGDTSRHGSDISTVGLLFCMIYIYTRVKRYERGRTCFSLIIMTEKKKKEHVMSNTWLELKANYFNDSVSLKKIIQT